MPNVEVTGHLFSEKKPLRAGRILEHTPSELGLGAATLAELRYEADLRGPKRLERLVGASVSGVRPVPFGPEAADRHGKVAAALARSGSRSVRRTR